jgi:hypothetical protein
LVGRVGEEGFGRGVDDGFGVDNSGTNAVAHFRLPPGW